MSDTSLRIVGTLADLGVVRSLDELVTAHVAAHEGQSREQVEIAYRAAIDRQLAPHGLALDSRDRVVALRPLPEGLDVAAAVRTALDTADLASIAREHRTEGAPPPPLDLRDPR
ncbi:hypothetical protein [Saccharothrix sp.]|uniref:hypothetical protein n=1 Tax=Saccharothrix sp. TaxID=1873460 RepID=UPI002810CD96|nr:hypothetical protein [Saccharothrix sp.]